MRRRAPPAFWPLAVIYATVAIDAAGVSLIFPVMPGLLRFLHEGREVSVLFGALMAVYALMQFLCAPVLGRLSDRFGRRPILLISLSGATIDYLIMAFTPTLWVLFLGRAIAGMMAANVTVATAFITDITPEAERARRFGFFQACVGLGFILGPVLGGMLGTLSLRDPFLAAAALNGVNLAIALFVLPESNQPQPGPIGWRALNPLRAFRWAIACRPLVPLLAVLLLMSLVGQTYGTIWVLFVEDRFGWKTAEVGLSLGLFGALTALVQTLAIRPSIRRFGERGTLLLGMMAEGLALLILAFAPAGWVAFAAIPVLAVGGTGLPALRALQTRAVDAGGQGQLQGVVTSVMSLAAIIGPLVFAWIYGCSPPGSNGAVWLLALALYGVALPIILAVPGETRS